MNKKEELLRNTAKIIYEEGIQRLTIDYLANQSDITKGGVLYHFTNKQDLLVQMNKLALRKFEDKVNYYLHTLSGPALYTRAYALATLHFLKHPESTLLPALFISSLEDEACLSLWKNISEQWDQSFQSDSGDPQTKLALRLICDGMWFSIIYASNENVNEQTEKLVKSYCDLLEKGSE